MIPQRFIEDWKHRSAPWPSLTMVEQDLVISRALVELYKQPKIRETLVFRGGTALNKIHLSPATRYSEDIDLVQIKSEPIGDIITAIRAGLDSWLGEPKRKLTERCTKLIYRFQSTENLSAKLKIEINTTEHYHALALKTVDFTVDSEWFRGTSQIITYQLNELIGSKLRALYQRRKGRDLFDLWITLKNNLIDPKKVVEIFAFHGKQEQQEITRSSFLKNLNEKSLHHDFRHDILSLITDRTHWSFDEALDLIKNQMLPLLPV